AAGPTVRMASAPASTAARRRDRRAYSVRTQGVERPAGYIRRRMTSDSEGERCGSSGATPARGKGFLPCGRSVGPACGVLVGGRATPAHRPAPGGPPPWPGGSPSFTIRRPRLFRAMRRAERTRPLADAGNTVMETRGSPGREIGGSEGGFLEEKTDRDGWPAGCRREPRARRDVRRSRDRRAGPRGARRGGAERAGDPGAGGGGRRVVPWGPADALQGEPASPGGQAGERAGGAVPGAGLPRAGAARAAGSVGAGRDARPGGAAPGDVPEIPALP